MKQQKWASWLKGGIYNPILVIKSGHRGERTIIGNRNIASTNTEKNNNGITALLFIILFLVMSYSPIKTAENALRYNHILLHQIKQSDSSGRKPPPEHGTKGGISTIIEYRSHTKKSAMNSLYVGGLA